jgi:hypothetical protein
MTEEMHLVGPVFGRISAYTLSDQQGRRLLGYAQKIPAGWVVGITGDPDTTVVVTVDAARDLLRQAYRHSHNDSDGQEPR